MTATERDQIHHLLLSLRRDLEGKPPVRIEPRETDHREVGAEEDEQPLQEMLQSIASSRNRSLGDVLHRVVEALQRLEDDPEAFGQCTDCGEDIPLARPRAMPYAQLCTECQRGQDAPRGLPTRRKLTDLR
jgi:DnaK suppressor protein